MRLGSTARCGWLQPGAVHRFDADQQRVARRCVGLLRPELATELPRAARTVAAVVSALSTIFTQQMKPYEVEICVAQVGTDEAFTLGPAYLRDDGLLVIGAISDDTLMSCGVEERRISVGTSKPVDYSTREVPFGSASTTGYENRPGGTTVGYAGDDLPINERIHQLSDARPT